MGYADSYSYSSKINHYDRSDRQRKELIEILENWDYYCGYTMQFWTGPQPEKDTDTYEKFREELKRTYRSYNVIKSAIHHYTDALVGQPFNFFYALDKADDDITEAEKDALNVADEYLQQWWDWQKKTVISSQINKPISEAVIQMLVTGTGYLRIYTPRRFQNLDETFKKLLLHAPKVGSVTVERDEDDFLYKATYNYDSGWETYELLDNGMTQLTSSRNEEPVEVDYGGMLPIFELRMPRLLDWDVKQCQNAINKTLTLKDKNVDYGGYRERVISNAQKPGKYVSDPSVPGGERFEPNQGAIRFGVNNIVFLQGIPIGDPKNPTGYTSPTLTYQGPVDVSTFENSLRIDYTVFWMLMGLGHKLSAADGNLSGVSRETIKGDFAVKMQEYEEVVEAVLTGVFSLVTLILARNDNKPELLDYSIKINLNLALGKPLPEDQQMTIAKNQSGLMSRTTAMSELGIEDPDAEQQLIKREEEESFNTLIEQQSIEQQVINDASA